MRKIIISLIVLILFAGCSNGGNDSSDNPKTSEQELQIGETAETDCVEFTMTGVQFTHVLGTDYSNWLRPTNNGGWGAGDGKTFLYVEFTAKNLESVEINGYDVSNISVRYMDKYIYDDTTFSGNENWSTSSSLSKNVGLPIIEPLVSKNLWGCIQCAEEVKNNREEIDIVVVLPSSDGEVSFVYKMPQGDSSLDNAKVSEFIDAINEVQGELNFCYKYIKNVPDANYGVADNVFDSLRNPLRSVDVDYFESAIPGITEKINNIQEKADNAAQLIEEMVSKRNSSYVERIEDVCKEGMNLISDLMDNELKDYK